MENTHGADPGPQLEYVAIDAGEWWRINVMQVIEFLASFIAVILGRDT